MKSFSTVTCWLLLLGSVGVLVTAEKLPNQEQITSLLAIVMEKCAEQKVGLVEASAAADITKKCFENTTPVPLPASSDDEEGWAAFKDAYAKDTCGVWDNLNKCLKPTLQILERCFQQPGFITGALEMTHEIMCVNQDEGELSKLATQAVSSWGACKFPSGNDFSEKLRPCFKKYLAVPNETSVRYLCKDSNYNSLLKCIVEKAFEDCDDESLAKNFYNFVANAELKNYLQKNAFPCATEKDEL